MVNYVSYLRVSTVKQGASGLGLEVQREAVRGYMTGDDALCVEVVEIESGRKNDRPKLAEALRLCRLHRAKLAIAKLDRLARNVAFVSNLMESKVEFVAVDFPQANDLTIHVLAAVAQHEATAVSIRTKAALAVVRSRGTKLGGNTHGQLDRDGVRSLGRASSLKTRKATAAAFVADVAPLVKEMSAEGLSLRQIAAQLGGRGIMTRHGKEWTAASVRSILMRA